MKCSWMLVGSIVAFAAVVAVTGSVMGAGGNLVPTEVTKETSIGAENYMKDDESEMIRNLRSKNDAHHHHSNRHHQDHHNHVEGSAGEEQHHHHDDSVPDHHHHYAKGEHTFERHHPNQLNRHHEQQQQDDEEDDTLAKLLDSNHPYKKAGDVHFSSSSGVGEVTKPRQWAHGNAQHIRNEWRQQKNWNNKGFVEETKKEEQPVEEEEEAPEIAALKMAEAELVIEERMEEEPSE